MLCKSEHRADEPSCYAGLDIQSKEDANVQVKYSGVPVGLRIGVIADGAPYYQKGLSDGKWRGFYIDICQKLADDLGLKLTTLETTWGNSVLDLQADKIDVFFGLLVGSAGA